MQRDRVHVQRDRDVRVVPRGERGGARLDRVPDARLPDVHGGVHRRAGRQRAGVLRGAVLRANALGHQPVHHEHGRRRPAHDAVLRAVLVRRHAPVAVLAVRQRPVPHGQLRAGRRRAGTNRPARVHPAFGERSPRPTLSAYRPFMILLSLSFPPRTTVTPPTAAVDITLSNRCIEPKPAEQPERPFFFQFNKAARKEVLKG